MPRITPVLLQMGDEAGDQHDVDVAAPGHLVGDGQAVALGVANR